jgi:hypothetical protein
MLSYGFAAPTAGCIVAGPPGKNCMYTLYVMTGAPGSETDDSNGGRTNTAAAGVAASGFPTRWAYRASISDPQYFGAEGPCEPQFAQLRDGRILLLMRYTGTPLMKSLSSNEGKTWSKPVISPLERLRQRYPPPQRQTGGLIWEAWHRAVGKRGWAR